MIYPDNFTTLITLIIFFAMVFIIGFIILKLKGFIASEFHRQMKIKMSEANSILEKRGKR